MKIKVFPARDLPHDLFSMWVQIQESVPELASPFFRPEFTQAVARVRDDAFVAVIDDGAAFFSFQRGARGAGRPVGGAMSDYHGLIAPPANGYDVAMIVRECGLSSWQFENVPADQPGFRPWSNAEADSLFVDVTRIGQLWSGKWLTDFNRKRRTLESKLGKLELELESSDLSVLDLCMDWKSAQYRRTGQFDLFETDWARQVLQQLAAHRSQPFAGVLSVLRAGGQPIAAHFGIRSSSVWHHWFPAYDLEYKRYSPGLLLLTGMIERASELGIKVLDFGRGEYDYKLRVANGRTAILSGCVTNGPAFFAFRQKEKFKNWMKTSDLVPRQLLQAARQIYAQKRFR